MFGSKNSELTRKYSSSSFDAITFGLSSSARVAYSTKPTATNDQREPDQHAEAGAQPPRRPLDVAQHREQQRERDVEEDGLLERLVERRRVGRLQRVEHDRRRRAATPSRRSRAAGRTRSPSRIARHRPGERAGRDHEVERDEQVRGRAARLDRDPERQRGERGERQERAAAARTARASGIDDERGDQRAAGQRRQRVLAHDVELRRLPDRQHQQHRRERERAEHRPARAPARRAARGSRRRPAPPRARSRSRGRPRARRRCRRRRGI